MYFYLKTFVSIVNFFPKQEALHASFRSILNDPDINTVILQAFRMFNPLIQENDLKKLDKIKIMDQKLKKILISLE